MDEKKETMSEIYAKLPLHKKLDNFIGMIPITVSVRDDVSKNRFAITEYKGKLNGGRNDAKII